MTLSIDMAPVGSQKLSLGQQSPLFLQREQLMEHFIIHRQIVFFVAFFLEYIPPLSASWSLQKGPRSGGCIAILQSSQTPPPVDYYCWLTWFISFTCYVNCLQKMEMFLLQFLLLKKQFVEAKNVIFFISIFGYNRK